MDMTIAVPWWLLVVALIATLVLLRSSVRQGFYRWLQQQEQRLDVARQGVEQRQHRLRGRAKELVRRYFSQLASMRLQVGLLSFERQFRHQQQQIAQRCGQLRELITELTRELNSAQLDMPQAPQWVAAVDAIAHLPVEQQSESIRDILSQIQQTAAAQHNEAMREYRWVMSVRNRTLATQKGYWQRLLRRCGSLDRALTRLNRQVEIIQLTVERYDGSRKEVLPARHGKVLAHFLLALLLLTLGVWTAQTAGGLFYRELSDLGLEAGSAQLVLVTIGTLVLLLGAILTTSLRWSAMILPLAELDIRPRRYLSAVSGIALLSVGTIAVSGISSSVQQVLATAGWSQFASYMVGGMLWLLPFLLSLQVLVVERLVRVCLPLWYLFAQWLMKLCAAAIGSLQQGLRHLLPETAAGKSGDVSGVARGSDEKATSPTGDSDS